MSLISELQNFTGNGRPPLRRARPSSIAAQQDMSVRPLLLDSGFQEAVQAEDSRTEATRTRGNSYLHVSALIHNPCSRKLMLLQTAEEAHRTRHFSSDRIVHALGRAAEHHVRTQYIEHVNASGVLGKWVCPCGETEHEPHYNPAPCRHCRKPASIYRELTLLDHEFRIVGSPDIIVCGQDDLIVPVEIKSMKIAEFMERRGESNETPFRPINEHIGQVSCYHKMLSDRFGDERMADYSLVYYVAKDYPRFGVNPYATVRVNMADEAPQRWQRDVWALAEELWAARQRDALPDRLRVCGRPSAPTAKACECVGPCFLRS